MQRDKGAIVASLSMDEAGKIVDFRTKLEADVIRAAEPRQRGPDQRVWKQAT